MDLIAKSIEEKIQEAIKNGEFKNLPGEGKPLDLDDDSCVPVEQRMGYRILKNAGFIPPEVEMKNEIAQIEEDLRTKNFSMDEEIALRKQLVLKQAAVSMILERFAKSSK